MALTWVVPSGKMMPPERVRMAPATSKRAVALGEPMLIQPLARTMKSSLNGKRRPLIGVNLDTPTRVPNVRSTRASAVTMAGGARDSLPGSPPSPEVSSGKRKGSKRPPKFR